MKILVTGAGGQLGYDVCRELATRGITHTGVERQDFDITNSTDVDSYIKVYRPDGVIHCAAYTKVDQAEREPEKCWGINADGVKNIAAACRKNGAKLIYLSTDYVFDGKGIDFQETGATPSPLNIYGKSKLAGEQIVQQELKHFFIVRTSWMFGIHGQNFVKSILKKAKTQDKLCVVDDQFGSPTYTKDLARLLCDMIATDKYGIYHAVNEGVCSWAEFAKEILLYTGIQTRVVEISATEYPSLAKRPSNSRMSTESLTKGGFAKLPSWKDALKRYLREEGAGK